MSPNEGQEFAGGPMQPVEQEFARGLRFTHIVLSAVEQQRDESVRFIEALNRLLVAKGIAGETELADTLADPACIPPGFDLFMEA